MAAIAVTGLDGSRLRWDLLEAQLPSGDQLTVRVALPGGHPDVLIGLDAARRRHVLVEIPPGEMGDFSERISRGITVQTVELRTGGFGTARFVEIVCLDVDGHAAMDIIAMELVSALEAGASIGRIRLVQNVLAKWRRFWAGINHALLSREAQLGLFGELWFLNRWLAPSIGASTAISMWRGPLGGRNDFETKGLAIEVKTTGRVDGAHVIHGLDQLQEPLGGRLLFFSVQVRDDATGNTSLSALVAETRELIGKDYDLSSQFDKLLYAAGYDDRLADEYGKLVLRVKSTGLYKVEAGFPRLVPACLPSGVPPGVGNVNYELRLEAAREWLLAEKPDDLAFYVSNICLHQPERRND